MLQTLGVAKAPALQRRLCIEAWLDVAGSTNLRRLAQEEGRARFCSALVRLLEIFGEYETDFHVRRHEAGAE